MYVLTFLVRGSKLFSHSSSSFMLPFISKPSSIFDLSSTVNACSHCHVGRLDHMNSVHKWLLKAKLDFIALSVSMYARVPACVSHSFVFVAPKLTSCGWDLIVRAAEAVAMALASEGRFFNHRGRKEKTLYRVTHPENIPVSQQKPHSVTVSVHGCIYVSMNVQKGFVPYQWPPPHVSFCPHPSETALDQRKAPKHQRHSDTSRASESEQTQLRER